MYELALNGYETSFDLIFGSFVGMIATLDLGSLEKTDPWRLRYSDFSNGKLIEIPAITCFLVFSRLGPLGYLWIV
tara:strand:- start:226 stop:450 length:225 start_codon:yes stop_codon:yes gene_type:complete